MKSKVKEAMKLGYIRVYRNLINWEWFTDVNTSHLFVYCMLRANHSSQKWQGKTLKKGTFITSLSKLADNTGLTIRQVRTSLNKLKTTNDLTYTTTNKFTVINVRAYCDWQNLKNENDKQNDTDNDKQMTRKRQTNDKQMTTDNKENNKRDYIHNLSLSERELLINFSKENCNDKRKYKAYFNKLLENGDYKTILEDLKQKELQKSKLLAMKKTEKREQNPDIKSLSEYSNNEIIEILQKNGQKKNPFKNPFVKLAEKEAEKRGLKL